MPAPPAEGGRLVADGALVGRMPAGVGGLDREGGPVGVHLRDVRDGLIFDGPPRPGRRQERE